MGSFKFRLVATFLLLSLLPLLAAFWGFSQVAARSETDRADARLNAALRVAVAVYADEVTGAEDDARSLARATRVQRALVAHDRSALVKVGREVPGSAFFQNGRLVAGTYPESPAARRSAIVVDEKTGTALGRIVVSVPLDDTLVEALRVRAGLEAGDRFVVAARGRVVAGPVEAVGDIVRLPVDKARYLELAAAHYRAVATDLGAGTGEALLVALTPKERLDASLARLRERLALFGAIALVLVGAAAYLLGGTIVRPLKELAEATEAIALGYFSRRVRVRGRDEFSTLARTFNQMAAQLEARLEELAEERARARDAVSRFGEALAATHDPYALLPVIVESTVEATGAAGGRLVLDGKELARAGASSGGSPPLVIPLIGEDGEHAVLELVPAAADFTDAERELAHWLGSQASIALENARLHRRVERQAVTDGLTELPNRRRFEESLEREINRVDRFGGQLALIFADIDDFKQVNDRYGHQAGDDVLRAFARVLEHSVREIDLPARYGGEEFAVLLPQTDLGGAVDVAERIRSALAARPIETSPGSLLAVTASFGVACFPDEPTPAALFAAADDALYRAKRGGKNCVVAADAGAPLAG
jgi:diguanylate cyclase (GGDEF)-like protein